MGDRRHDLVLLRPPFALPRYATDEHVQGIRKQGRSG
jgi:hypothetical protein